MKFVMLLFFFIVIVMILIMKEPQRTVWLFVGVLTLTDSIEIGPINAYTLYLVAFIASLYIHGEIKQEWNDFPFKGILVILLLLHTAVALHDGRIHDNPIRMASRIFNNYVPRYLALFVGYAALNNLKDWRKIMMPLFTIFAFMGIYGVFTWYLQGNPYYEMMNGVFRGKAGIWTEVQSRGYRVMSTLTNPIVYSFVMCMAGHFIFLWRKSMNFVPWVCLLSLVILNAFLANSRTGMVAGLLLVFLFLLSKYRLSWRIYASITMCLLTFSVAYFTIPQIRNVSDSVIDIIASGGNQTEGSNVTLKLNQMKASAYFFAKSPLFGNGFHYFSEVLLRKDISYTGGTLAGLEGYGYKLLVEEGLFMILGVSVFFFRLCTYFFRRRYLGIYAHAGIAWTVSFLAFLMFAGEYGGVFTIGILLIGMLLKFIQQYEILYLNTCLQCSCIHRSMSGQHIGTDGE